MTIQQVLQRKAQDTNTQLRGMAGLIPNSLNEEKRSLDFVCSTEALDSYGTILRQDWDLTRYRANPVVFWVHNRREIPVGRATNIRVENRQLMATVIFATEEERKGAEEIWQAYKSGLSRGISVGFSARSYRFEKINNEEVLVFEGLSLDELSLCPLPSNPEALARSADDPTLLVLEHLRSQRAPLSHNPSHQDSTMTPEQLEALKAQLRAALDQNTANTREIELIKKQVETATRELTEARGELAKKDGEVKDRDGKIELLTKETERLNKDLTEVKTSEAAAKKRADDAEDGLVREQLRLRMGEDVDPIDVEHLVKMARNFPEMFKRELNKLDAAPKKGMTRQTLPTESGSDNRTPAAPADGALPPSSEGASGAPGARSISDAIRKHMPPEAKG